MYHIADDVGKATSFAPSNSEFRGIRVAFATSHCNDNVILQNLNGMLMKNKEIHDIPLLQCALGGYNSACGHFHGWNAHF